MADIEHTISGSESSAAEIGEDMDGGYFILLGGNGTQIKCYLDHHQIQRLCNSLGAWGFVPCGDDE